MDLKEQIEDTDRLITAANLLNEIKVSFYLRVRTFIAELLTSELTVAEYDHRVLVLSAQVAEWLMDLRASLPPSFALGSAYYLIIHAQNNREKEFTEELTRALNYVGYLERVTQLTLD